MAKSLWVSFSRLCGIARREIQTSRLTALDAPAAVPSQAREHVLGTTGYMEKEKSFRANRGAHFRFSSAAGSHYANRNCPFRQRARPGGATPSTRRKSTDLGRAKATFPPMTTISIPSSPTSSSAIRLRSAACSDIGRMRRENQDRLLCDDVFQLYGVADGVGGLPGGAEAAECAMETVRRCVAQSGSSPDVHSQTLAANAAVVDLGARLYPGAGIATTLTWGVFRGTSLRLAHVGDSRCYGLRSGRLDLLTSDHSLENEARLRRKKGEQVWVSERNRHAITRCIGQPAELEIDLVVRAAQAGDRYLFCTDGLTGLVGDSEIKERLEWAMAPEHIARSLVELANQRGGRDNTTVVVVFVDSPR